MAQLSLTVFSTNNDDINLALDCDAPCGRQRRVSLRGNMKLGENNFLEYLGSEEQNLLTSITNFKNEFDIFYDLDRIYQEPLKRLVVTAEKTVVPQLYLFVHFHLYFSFSCLFSLGQ